MILIVAGASDGHVPWVTPKLDALEADYCSFDPEDYPSRSSFSVHYSRTGRARQILTSKGARIDSSEISAVWYRARPRIHPVPDPLTSGELKAWTGETCTRALTEFWESLECLWLPNRPRADRDHFHRLSEPSPYSKLHQLRIAGRMGLAVPRTLVTNDPDEFLDFYEQFHGHVISKSLYSLPATRNGEELRPFTFTPDRRSLREFRSIRFAPVIFQETIPKKIELRVTVVGTKVFSASIGSQDAGTRLQADWRHYPEFEKSRIFSRHQLPEDLEKRCVDLVAALGLCFGAIDLIMTPEGEYVFLEINPNGQWAFIEHLTGLPIAGAVADILVRGVS